MLIIAVGLKTFKHNQKELHITIRELSFEEMNFVSGGNADSGYERGGDSDGMYGRMDSCGAGIVGGIVAGSPGGLLGMTVGVIGGMIAGQCTKDSFSSKGNIQP